MARIVVLNGTSSAGKSSLARKLQEIAPDPWLHIPLDKFISMLAHGREHDPEWFVVRRSTDEDGHPLTSITNGPRGAALLGEMRAFVAGVADRGMDIIVDDVCTAPDVLDYRERLSHHSLTVTKVEADIDTIARREMERGNREPGLARYQAQTLHEGIEYDLVIENPDGKLDATARKLLAAIS